MPHISCQWPNPNFWLNNPQTIRNRLMDVLRFLFTYVLSVTRKLSPNGANFAKVCSFLKKVFASQISNFLHYCEIGNFFKRSPYSFPFLFCSSVTEIVVVCTSNLNPQSQCCDNLIFLLSGTIEGGRECKHHALLLICWWTRVAIEHAKFWPYKLGLKPNKTTSFGRIQMLWYFLQWIFWTMLVCLFYADRFRLRCLTEGVLFWF